MHNCRHPHIIHEIQFCQWVQILHGIQPKQLLGWLLRTLILLPFYSSANTNPTHHKYTVNYSVILNHGRSTLNTMNKRNSFYHCLHQRGIPFKVWGCFSSSDDVFLRVLTRRYCNSWCLRIVSLSHNMFCRRCIDDYAYAVLA